MKSLIIEDEELASKRLKNMIHDLCGDCDVLDIVDSVESSVSWFQKNSQPDLIFMDIQLSDGLCFEIFDRVNIESPIIFTTAFDEYAIQAFKVNSIDYLLKPIDKNELKAGIDKFKKLYEVKEPDFNKNELKSIIYKLAKNQPVYKSRFLIKTGQSFKKITAEDIAYFFVDNKITFLQQKTGEKFYTDYTLDVLENELDPHQFFRVNRQFILNFDSIQDVHSYFSGKLKIHVMPKPADEIIVSRIKASVFKEWLNR